ncbi:MAG: hypothetical protein LBH25_10065 [Fibromonadaceae bacterium]|jgi:hypothetical protein|nr:hypothetical protein [Fibromonadaceae bacterium]
MNNFSHKEYMRRQRSNAVLKYNGIKSKLNENELIALFKILLKLDKNMLSFDETELLNLSKNPLSLNGKMLNLKS